jgi:hypothetical protein
MTLKLPSWVAVTLGLIAGILAILNEVTFGLDAELRGYVSIVLVFLVGLGITPLVGPAFRAALHLSQTVSLFISTGLAALALAIHTLNVTEGVRSVLQFVLVFAAAIGFAPISSGSTTVAVR